jgi:hypothetical protein
MSLIDVRPLSHESAAEIRARHRAAKERLWGPVPRREPSAQVIPLRNAQPIPEEIVPVSLMGDDDYADIVMGWTTWLARQPTKRLTAHDMAMMVGATFGVNLNALKGRSRRPLFVLPRQVVMYLCVNVLGYSFPRTGLFLNRDHSTVLYGVDKISKRMASDFAFASRINSIVRACGGHNG